MFWNIVGGKGKAKQHREGRSPRKPSLSFNENESTESTVFVEDDIASSTAKSTSPPSTVPVNSNKNKQQRQLRRRESSRVDVYYDMEDQHSRSISPKRRPSTRSILREASKRRPRSPSRTARTATTTGSATASSSTSSPSRPSSPTRRRDVPRGRATMALTRCSSMSACVPPSSQQPPSRDSLNRTQHQSLRSVYAAGNCNGEEAATLSPDRARNLSLRSLHSSVKGEAPAKSPKRTENRSRRALHEGSVGQKASAKSRSRAQHRSLRSLRTQPAATAERSSRRSGVLQESNCSKETNSSKLLSPPLEGDGTTPIGRSGTEENDQEPRRPTMLISDETVRSRIKFAGITEEQLLLLQAVGLDIDIKDTKTT